jgi:hypothetical protein
VEAVEEDTLRYLPAVLDLFVRMPDRYAEAIVVEHSLIRLLGVFRGLHAAAGDWAQGCRTTHLPAVKERAQELASACRHFDDAVARLV